MPLTKENQNDKTAFLVATERRLCRALQRNDFPGMADSSAMAAHTHSFTAPVIVHFWMFHDPQTVLNPSFHS